MNIRFVRFVDVTASETIGVAFLDMDLMDNPEVLNPETFCHPKYPITYVEESDRLLKTLEVLKDRFEQYTKHNRPYLTEKLGNVDAVLACVAAIMENKEYCLLTTPQHVVSFIKDDTLELDKQKYSAYDELVKLVNAATSSGTEAVSTTEA